MHWAVSSQNLETMKELLKLGADPLGGHDETPVYVCVTSDFPEGLEVFLDHAPSLLFEEDFEGNSLLHIAASHGVLRIAEILVKRGVDVNAKNDDGETALDVASSFPDNPVSSLLSSLSR